MISSHQLQALVAAAKAIGEDQVTTQLPDGTIIEIHLRPRLEGEAPSEPILPPLPLLIQRLRAKLCLFHH